MDYLWTMVSGFLHYWEPTGPAILLQRFQFIGNASL